MTTKPYKLLPRKVFRETEGVSFYDISVEGCNAQDLVVHTGPAISPPNDPNTGAKQFYIHYHQTDNNRVLNGSRVFELVNFRWEEPYQVVHLTPESGGLVIEPGTFHRSVSGLDGSMLINQAIRNLNEFDLATEFSPVSVSETQILADVVPVDEVAVK